MLADGQKQVMGYLSRSVTSGETGFGWNDKVKREITHLIKQAETNERERQLGASNSASPQQAMVGFREAAQQFAQQALNAGHTQQKDSGVCPFILKSCLIDAHFTAWRINQQGTFRQDPEVGATIDL